MTVIDVFLEQLRTNRPIQITFAGAILTLIAGIIVGFTDKITALAVLGFAAFNIAVLMYQVYLVYCVQNGKCGVLSYVLSCAILVIGILSLVLAIYKAASPKLVIKMTVAKKK